jgi:hypothetical protein
MQKRKYETKHGKGMEKKKRAKDTYEEKEVMEEKETLALAKAKVKQAKTLPR